MKSKVLVFTLFVAGAVAAAFIVTAQQQKKDDRSGQINGIPGMSNEEMNKRGDRVMGFDHTKTTHHFRLFFDGGAIEITANSADDSESRDQIRAHLGHIAKMFAAGNFHAPMLIHDQTPPGVPVMQKLESEIKYQFEETLRGATIHINTKNREALQAIHDFLRFQIKEHQTGDSLEVSAAETPAVKAQDLNTQKGQSKYAGQEKREIKALSPDEIQAYESGQGMGLAKAAELNQFPGPKHVLELATELKLSDQQKTETQKIYDRMHAEATRLGALLIAKERELDQLFAAKQIDSEKLQQGGGLIARMQGELRVAHLQAHLETRRLLSPGQIMKYEKARGYDSGGADHHQHKL